MKNICFLIFLIFLIFYSCGAEFALQEEINPNMFIPQNCFIDIEDASQTMDNCRPSRLENCLFIEEIEGLYTFNDTSRTFVPWSCLDIGEKIFYENGDGDRTYFSIISKEHILTKDWFFWESCSALPNYCFNVEDYSIRLESEDKKYELALNLRMQIRIKDESFHKTDYLNVYEYDLENLKSISIFLWGLQDNLTESNYARQFDVSTSILGETFTNVYSMTDEWDANKSDEKFYNNIFYNKEYGIISFTDKSGNEWKILN